MSSSSVLSERHQRVRESLDAVLSKSPNDRSCKKWHKERVAELEEEATRPCGWYWVICPQQNHMEWVDVEMPNYWTGEGWMLPGVFTKCLGPVAPRIKEPAQ